MHELVNEVGSEVGESVTHGQNSSDYGVHGQGQEFFFTRLFTLVILLAGFYPRILVATAAANTGIDQEMLDCILRISLPRCIIAA